MLLVCLMWVAAQSLIHPQGIHSTLAGVVDTEGIKAVPF